MGGGQDRGLHWRAPEGTRCAPAGGTRKMHSRMPRASRRLGAQDVDALVSAAMEGRAWTSVLDRLIADAVEQV